MLGLDKFNRKISLFALSLVVISLIAVSPALAAVGEHLTIVDSQTAIAGNSLKAKITTQIAIPIDGQSGAFGYAIATGSLNNNVLVFATHLPIDDSSFEDRTSGFHSHVLDLRTVDQTDTNDACAGTDAEIDVANSQLNTGFDTRYSWTIKDNMLLVKHANVDHLNSGTVSGIVSFTITPLPDATAPQHLCIDLIGIGVGE